MCVEPDFTKFCGLELENNRAKANFAFNLFRTSGPTSFHDKVFLMEMNRQLIEAHEAYDKLLFKEALRVGFFELQAARDKYRELCGEGGMARQLVLQYIQWQAIILSPICPHVCEHVWELLGNEVWTFILCHVCELYSE